MTRSPVACALLLASSPVLAEDDPEAWHFGGRVGVVVPLATGAFTNATGFGGNVGGWAYQGRLDVQVDLAAFTREDDALDEVLGYRVRAAAGYRHVHPSEPDRAIVLRALGGIELGGFDEVATTDYAPEAYRLGFAALLAAESTSVMDWGGIVSLSVVLGISVQPFGDEAAGEARYVGLEVMPNIALGF